MLLHWLGLAAGTALACRPVKDFRVPSLQSVKGNSKQNVPVQGVNNAAASSVAYSVSTVESLPSSVATIGISDDVQFVYTDDSQSIFYINTTFTDSKTDYEQTFQLVLDSGSDLSWIYNDTCDSQACKKSLVPKFNDSRSFKSSENFQLSYSGDSVSGKILSTSSSDGCIFAFNSLSLSSFEIGLANEAPTIFNDYDVSGILGIPSLSSKLSMFSQLSNAKVIDKAVFSLALVSSNQRIEYKGNKNVSSLPPNYGGLIFFGSEVANNQKKFTDSIVYLDVEDNDNAYWLVNLTDISTSNLSYSGDFQSSNKSLHAIIDTGTTGLALPIKDSDRLHSELFGLKLVTDDKGNYAFPCDADANITISLDGNKFTIPVADFKGAKYDGQLQGYCASKIQGLENNEYWILGSIFLRNYYAIFDNEKSRIGLGENKLSLYMLTVLLDIAQAVTTTSASASTDAHAHNNSSSSKTSSKHSKTSLADSSGLIAGLSYALLCIFAYII